jgi:hypothetical protein
MSHNPIIYTPDGDGLLGVTATDLVEAALRRWPNTEVVWTTTKEADPSDVTLRIQGPEDTRWFQVFHSRELDTLWVEGTEHQAARIALWLRTLIPTSEGKRVVLLDTAVYQAAIVEPGMTPNEVIAACTLEPPVPG